MEALKQKAWGGAAPHPPPRFIFGPDSPGWGAAAPQTHHDVFQRLGDHPRVGGPPGVIIDRALIQEPLSRVPEFLSIFALFGCFPSPPKRLSNLPCSILGFVGGGGLRDCMLSGGSFY